MTMDFDFPKRALGTPVPDSPHAVCVHFPTLEDIIGYEEKSPRVMAAVRTGYPRFRKHPWIERLETHLGELHGLAGRMICLVGSARAAVGLQGFTGAPEGGWLREGEIALFHAPDRPEYRERAKRFLQHTGTMISSRQAEELLAGAGILNRRTGEAVVAEGGADLVRRAAGAMAGLDRPDRVVLCNSGMNAFYALFRALREWQRPQGRRVWVQLGWLYLDTAKILEEMLEEGETCRVFYDPGSLDELENFLQEAGHQVAGLVTEFPTNPLVRCADLERLRGLADRHGFPLIIDPTLAGAPTVAVAHLADAVVMSLTKYAGNEGDLMMGMVAVNPERDPEGQLNSLLGSYHQPPGRRDVARMAWEIQRAPEVVATIEGNTRGLLAHLREHPAVARIHWAGGDPDGKFWRAQARDEGAAGGVFSMELKGSLAGFLAACPLVIGPSFGTRFTIVCPYLYLAHYDLVSQPEGRGRLRALGMNPDLLRIGVGTEPLGYLIEGLERGLRGS